MPLAEAVAIQVKYTTTGSEGSTATVNFPSDSLNPTGGLPVDIKAATVTATATGLGTVTVLGGPGESFLEFRDGLGNTVVYYAFSANIADAGTQRNTVTFSQGVMQTPVLYLEFSAQPPAGATVTVNFFFHAAASPVPGQDLLPQFETVYGYADGFSTTTNTTLSLEGASETVAGDARFAALSILHPTDEAITSATLTFVQTVRTTDGAFTQAATTQTYKLQGVDVPAATVVGQTTFAGYQTLIVPLPNGVAPAIDLTLGFAAAVSSGQVAAQMILQGAGGPDVIAAAGPTAATTMQNAAAATGAGTGLATNGQGVAVVDLQITNTATVTWQGVGPGGNTFDLNAVQVGGSSTAPSMTPSSTATASGLYRVNCAGASTVYANVTAWTSGTVTATGQAQPLTAADSVSLSGSNLSVTYVDSDTTLTAAAGGGSQSINITPPTGQLWELTNATIIAPAVSGATSGAYSLNLEDATDGTVQYLTANATYSASANLQSYEWANVTAQTPATGAATVNAIQSVGATAARPVRVFVYNNTNAAMSGTLQVRTVWRVTTITG